MQPEERDAAKLFDMLEAARAVVSFVQGKTLADYVGDSVLHSAVERKVEIIGEAARGVSRTFRATHPEIAWCPIMAQRHVLAHDYGEIIHAKIWKVATVYVPQLTPAVDATDSAVATGSRTGLPTLIVV